jgi:septum formation inhibitor MinC
MELDEVPSSKLQEILQQKTEQVMQFFMLNRLCIDMIENAFSFLINGFHQVREAAFQFICKMVVSIASTPMRLQLLSQIKELLNFEFTKSSQKQILYLRFCNYVLPVFTKRFVTIHLLEDILKHACRHVNLQQLEVFQSLMEMQIQASQKKQEQSKIKEQIAQRWTEFQDKKSNLQVQTQVFFLTHTLPLLNDHLTYQDEELTLSLITIIDQFKNIEEDSYKGAAEVSDAAFAIDEQISFNLPDASQKKKQTALEEINHTARILRILSESQKNGHAKDTGNSVLYKQLDSDLFCLQEIIKNQREQRLAVREQFENDHEDASIHVAGSSERGRSEEDMSMLSEMIKKSRLNKQGKGGYNPASGLKKVQTTTFGTTKRFAPEPGSIHSKSQQKVLNSFKKSTTGIFSSVSKPSLIGAEQNDSKGTGLKFLGLI